MSSSPGGAASSSGSLALHLRVPSTSSRISSPPSSSPPSKTRAKQRFHIQPPSLSATEKKKYQLVRLPPEPDIQRVDEIIGEHRDGQTLYYYARFQSGIAYRIPESVCLAKLPKLVEAYQENRASNNLPYQDFDPSANYVHPESRVVLNRNTRSTRTTKRPRYIESESESSEGNNKVDDYSASEAESIPLRSTRSSGRGKVSSFPSKKTRSRTRTSSVEEGSEYTSSPTPRGPTRRSTRAGATQFAKHIDSDSFDDDIAPVRSAPRETTRRKAARPEYGRLRDIRDLDEMEVTPLQKHYDNCSKCQRERADLVMKRKGKKRKVEEDEMEPHELGGWIQCLKCPNVAHWSCLSKPQQDEILKAIRTKELEEWQRENEGSAAPLLKPPKRVDVDTHETTEFVCAACSKGGDCFVCLKSTASPVADSAMPLANEASNADIQTTDGEAQSQRANDPPATTLLFRCSRCSRVAHYDHLPQPHPGSDLDTLSLALYYQTDHLWKCITCVRYTHKIDAILAWRPFPSDAVEVAITDNYKSPLPREYLIKWLGKSYRRVDWVPHAWLVAVHGGRLKNFLSSPPKDIFQTSDDGRVTDAEDGTGQNGSRAGSSKGDETYFMPHTACPDAENKIPAQWKSADRVLDILFWCPREEKQLKLGGKRRRVDTDDEQEKDDAKAAATTLESERAATYEAGEEPNHAMVEDLNRWQKRNKRMITEEDAEELSAQAAWVFVKWKDLGYEQATWDSPPRVGEPGFEEFQLALVKYARAQSVLVPKKSSKDYAAFDKRLENAYKRKYYLKSTEDLRLGQDPSLKLMPFQVDGFNWLCDNWWRLQHCILADEMGLGKTVQISAFLGKVTGTFQAFPALVVVPNSTITNWVRELERWAPALRVVPFYGERASRKVIKEYELTHRNVVSGTTGAKFHVLVTTYETITTSDDFNSVFKKQPRWEVLVVDEGQRLKNDSSMIFRKLNELNTVHRIILTGTPLNNNIRELFNLMNFLDPKEWKGLEALEKEHEELNEELIRRLHSRLRPYFLRRIKSEVLELPPKNEVIVPISMAPLQKEIYKSILSKNVDILKSLTQPVKGKNAAIQAKTKVSNVLMQLRKCLQHPYLYEEGIEPKGLTPNETHEKLVNASGKLRFLKLLLPKLKARGHRVLLFSQFVIALDVIEDFLVGEGIKYLRLDGNTKQAQRQKDMDSFNTPGSDVFIYLLTTRAGGVGINLWTADTVVIFDPDFNPHQDLQAIARAHRYGQTKTCLVFKLMVKESAEERIMQVGKKKLVLDHLIVQKMDDEDGPGQNIQSILTYGAKALFESEGTKDMIYTEHDVDTLIEKTEKEGDKQETPKGGLAFSFAKVWSADKDSLEEIEEAPEEIDSWAQTLQRLSGERQKAIAEEVTGRGAKRRAAHAKPQQFIPEIDDVLTTPKPKGKASRASGEDSDIDNDSDYGPARSVSSIESADSSSAISRFEALGSMDEANSKPSKLSKTSKFITPIREGLSSGSQARSTIHDHLHLRTNPDYCGLCDTTHGNELGNCPMTEKSENLAEYREMLLINQAYESIEQRRIAINAIDEILSKRGHQNLIYGQPLYLVEEPPKAIVQHQFQQPKASQHRSNPSKVVPQPQAKQLPKPSSQASIVPSTIPPRPSPTPQSKRPSSPIFAPFPKKPRPNAVAPCPICNHTPFHLVKDCPDVKAGPQSISATIRRLEAKPGAEKDSNIPVLRRLLKKQLIQLEDNSKV